VDILGLMKQATEMQAKMAQMQEDLARITVTGSAGGGMVTAEADGKGAVRRIKIDPTVVNAADVEMLEDLVTAAVSDSQKKAADAAAVEMGKLTGGLNLPFPLKLPY
jgi:DNA-binding YbaB/EbfC family protein